MERIRFGPFALEPATGVVWRGEERVALAPKAAEVLLALVERAGAVVAKEELIARVWPDVVVEEANLSVHVSALRRALGRREDGRPYLETVHRRGYRFVAPVLRVGAPEPPSLAVLPFRQLGAESEEGRLLGFGMADALITRLARLHTLRVRPTSAVLRFAGAEAADAARALRVGAVVEGRLQRSAGRLRVTVQLVPAGGPFSAWGGAFEEASSDLFRLQEAAAEAVARALGSQLGAEAPGAAHRGTESLAAYGSLVRGRYFWSRLSQDSLGRAVAAFQEAAALDPRYADPHAGLAEAAIVLGFTRAAEPHEAWELAEAEARQALALEPALAGAHVALAYVRLFRDWDWPEAAAALEAALRLEPRSPTVRQWRGLFFDLLGRFEDARREVELAAALDPVSVVAHTLAGLQHYLARDHGAEIAAHHRTIELDPHQFLGHWGLGLACAALGWHEEAITEHRLAVQRASGSSFLRAVLARSLALAGQAPEAEMLLEASTEASAYQRATVLVALGRPAEALDALETACDGRDPWVVWLRVDPMLDPLRGKPAFETLVGRVFSKAEA